ncbi:uncharacterized protein [Physcomitrium patens]|uniref:uncharacterized protein isoform X3 n=1 Tax=Physcomitrium patens TaxID=3218 RepID=UPI000D16E641|nr:uncharacterized protein LOC112284536 isoform X3 [Physcomitrium patens]|eukprot:XP_024380183.1 uncharacterized protein LOC112284536 isoform X3 [Physcomitrella patens]
MENKALLWSKPEKVGWLFHQKRNLQVKEWKKLNCMIKGNYLFYTHKLNQQEPTGMMALKGGGAERARYDPLEPTKHCFLVLTITMLPSSAPHPQHIPLRNVPIHASYSFAAASLAECLSWVECINEAAQSIHIPRLKLEYAHNQVEGLKARWVKSQIQDSGKEVESDLLFGEEDPLVLQALANDLMSLYHLMDLAKKSKDNASKQLNDALHHIAELKESTSKLEEQVDNQHKDSIEKAKADVNKINGVLEPLLFLRQSLQNIEVLDGGQEYGPEVRVVELSENVLEYTLKKIQMIQKKKEDVNKRNSLPNEDEIYILSEKLNVMYQDELALLQRALPKENIELVSQFGGNQLKRDTHVSIGNESAKDDTNVIAEMRFIERKESIEAPFAFPKKINWWSNKSSTNHNNEHENIASNQD